MFSILDLVNIYSVVACAVVFLWHYSRSTYGYWRKLNVKYVEPVPFLGNTAKVFFGWTSLHEEYDRFYKALYDEPFGGLYQFRQPLLLVKDPELVAAILIKDFRYFPNRGFDLLINKDKKRDPLSTHLIFTDDERWKALRQKLSPAFSSGKLKNMRDQILNCVDLLMQHVDEQMGHDESIDLSMQDLFEKLTIDVIGSCAFGLDCSSTEKFGEMGRAALKPRIIVALRMLVSSIISKWLGALLNKTIMTKEVNEFYMNLALDTIEYRRKNGLVRNDLLQLLMELQNSHVDPKFAVGDQNLKILPNGM